MSVNYYARTSGETGEGLHIGQRASGTEFLFRAHPEKGLAVCDGWLAYLRHPAVTGGVTRTDTRSTSASSADWLVFSAGSRTPPKHDLERCT